MKKMYDSKTIEDFSQRINNLIVQNMKRCYEEFCPDAQSIVSDAGPN